MIENKEPRVDFNRLMQELLELEKSNPNNPDIPALKASIQKELDRQNKKTISSDKAVPHLNSAQDDLSVLAAIFDAAETNKKNHSAHHHTSHHSSHHRHHKVSKPTPTNLGKTDSLGFDDLLYDETEKALPHPSHSKENQDSRVQNKTLKSAVTQLWRPSHRTGDSVKEPHNRTKNSVSPPNQFPIKGKKAKETPKPRGSYPRWKKTVCIVLCIVLLLGFGSSIAFLQFMGRINMIGSDEIPELSLQELEDTRNSDPNDPSITIDKKDRYGVGLIDITPKQRDDVLNILLIGQDRRKGDKGQMRSDSMILVTIDKTSKEMKLTSLMRDMYVPVPGYGYGMINATLLNGGMKLLNATIEQNFGVHIDGDIQIDFYRFIKLMDLIGPLGLELNAEEVAYFKKTKGWNYSVGYNELNSEQVLAYARTRSVGRSDWERTDRQRKVITAIYSKLKKSDLSSLIKFTYDAMPLITTNINKNSDLINIVYTILVNRMSISQSNRIPVEGTYSQEVVNDTLHVLVPELRPNARALQEIAFG